MCSICKSILHRTSLPHLSDVCPLKKSLWCEFCLCTGHSQWICPKRLERERQLFNVSLESDYSHPEKNKLYKKPTIYLPKTERAIRAMLKGFGGSYATDPDITKERLRKKLRSLNYEILET
jgi:hypothetical protein